MLWNDHINRARKYEDGGYYKSLMQIKMLKFNHTYKIAIITITSRYCFRSSRNCFYAFNCIVNPIFHTIVIGLNCWNCARVYYTNSVQFFWVRVLFFSSSTHEIYRVFNRSFSFRSIEKKSQIFLYFMGIAHLFSWIEILLFLPCNHRKIHISTLNYPMKMNNEPHAKWDVTEYNNNNKKNRRFCTIHAISMQCCREKRKNPNQQWITMPYERPNKQWHLELPCTKRFTANSTLVLFKWSFNLC